MFFFSFLRASSQLSLFPPLFVEISETVLECHSTSLAVPAPTEWSSLIARRWPGSLFFLLFLISSLSFLPFPFFFSFSADQAGFLHRREGTRPPFSLFLEATPFFPLRSSSPPLSPSPFLVMTLYRRAQVSRIGVLHLPFFFFLLAAPKTLSFSLYFRSPDQSLSLGPLDVQAGG